MTNSLLTRSCAPLRDVSTIYRPNCFVQSSMRGHVIYLHWITIHSPLPSTHTHTHTHTVSQIIDITEELVGVGFVTLICEAISYPEPQSVVWELAGTGVDQNDNTIENDFDFTVTSMLENQPCSNQQYRCTITNEAGLSSSQTYTSTCIRGEHCIDTDCTWSLKDSYFAD